MSLSTELSGVQGAQTDIDTIGNNIANVNTTGFKNSVANFADLYGSAVQTTPGQGVFTAGLAQSFTEGTVSQTGKPTGSFTAATARSSSTRTAIW
jgi:flagellar hook protein FlgE